MSRLFLLLLLGVDWAASPEQLAPAVRLLARPLASTECFCHSLVQRPTDSLAEAHHPPDSGPLPPPAFSALPPHGRVPSGLRRQGEAAAPPRTSLQTLFCTWQV
jgi:hypothetical protein